jgi:hypothetical protein
MRTLGRLPPQHGHVCCFCGWQLGRLQLELMKQTLKPRLGRRSQPSPVRRQPSRLTSHGCGAETEQRQWLLERGSVTHAALQLR